MTSTTISSAVVGAFVTRATSAAKTPATKRR